MKRRIVVHVAVSKLSCNVSSTRTLKLHVVYFESKTITDFHVASCEMINLLVPFNFDL